VSGPTPDFDELMEGLDAPEDRERLRRVHELLVQAGPPPELSPALASAPVPQERERRPWWSRRAATALAFAALIAATFAIGYFAGQPESDEDAVAIRDTIAMKGGAGVSGALQLGYKGDDGNWPMLVRVEGLEQLRGGDYYTLALTRDGKPVVTCGTFNVSGRAPQTVRMSAAYNLTRFDGWVVLHYDAKTHKDKKVLWTGKVKL
jgi:hypothetical protein